MRIKPKAKLAQDHRGTTLKRRRHSSQSGIRTIRTRHVGLATEQTRPLAEPERRSSRLEQLEQRLTLSGYKIANYAIGQEWAAYGGQYGLLGGVIDNGLPGTGNVETQRFQNGFIYSSPETGALAVPYSLPMAADERFSYSYLQVRQQFLSEFFFDGFVAQSRYTDSQGNVHLVFSDQTKDMGDALVTFSQEARILANNHIDASGSEHVVTILLQAFDQLQGAAVAAVYPGARLPQGFFVRDFVSQNGPSDDSWRQDVPANAKISSDFDSSFKSNPGDLGYMDAVASLDQMVYMMNGWWAVTQYSTDSENRAHAAAQTENLMNYLMAVQYQTPVINGQAVRQERGGGDQLPINAGFLSEMADQITGGQFNYFVNQANDADFYTLDFGGVTQQIHDAVEAYVSKATSALSEQAKDLFNWDPAADVVTAIGNYISSRLIPREIAFAIPASVMQGYLDYLLLYLSPVAGAYFSEGLQLNLSLPAILGSSIMGALDSIKFNIPSGVSVHHNYEGIYSSVSVSLNVRSISLGEIIDAFKLKINTHVSTFAKHLALVEMAHESALQTMVPILATSDNFNDVWAVLLQSSVFSFPVTPEIISAAQSLDNSAPPSGPTTNGPAGWSSKNRFETGGSNDSITDPINNSLHDPATFNGLDFMSLETMMVVKGIPISVSPPSFNHTAFGDPGTPGLYTIYQGQTLNVDVSASDAAGYPLSYFQTQTYKVIPPDTGGLTGGLISNGELSITGNAGTLVTIEVAAYDSNDLSEYSIIRFDVHIVSAAPRIATFVSDKVDITGSATDVVTFTAAGVAIDFGAVQNVGLYQDTNADGKFEFGKDVEIGALTYDAGNETWTITRTFDVPAGTLTVFAVASSAGGEMSPAKQITLQVGPAKFPLSLATPSGAPIENKQGNGESFGAWVNYDANGDVSEVYFVQNGGDQAFLQRFDSAGNEIDSPIALSDVSGLNDVAFLPDGEFVVLWRDNSGDLLAKEFFADGSVNDPTGLGIIPIESSNPYITSPRIAISAPGEYAVVFAGTRTSGNIEQGQVYFHLFSGGFDTYDESLPDATGAGSVAVAMDAGGASVVVWGSNEVGGGAFAQRISSFGQLVGGAILLNTLSEYNAFGFSVGTGQISVAVDDSGNFAAVWTIDSIAAGAGNQVYARRFSSTGALDAQEMLVNDLASTPRGPLVALYHGKMVVAWAGNGTEGQAYLWDNTLRPLGGNFHVPLQAAGDTVNIGPFGIAIDPAGSSFIVGTTEEAAEGSDTYYSFLQRYQGLDSLPSSFSLINEAPLTGPLMGFSDALSMGTAIGSFQLADQPTGAGLWNFSLVSDGAGDADNGAFKIVNGELITNTTFNANTQSTFSLRVRATPDVGLSIEQVFNLYLTGSTFKDGEVLTNFEPLAPALDYVRASAVQPDGKVLVVGQRGVGANEASVVARYDTDGSLDTSFGGKGYVIATPDTGFSVFTAVALQSDGKIVAVGYGFNSVGNSHFIMRYNADGTLDTTFGDGGLVVTPFGTAVAIQDDGGIDVLDQATAGPELARYLSNGALDTSFGTGGTASAAIPNLQEAISVTVQPDGKLLVLGDTYDKTSKTEGRFVARFMTSGALDTSFNNSGYEEISTLSTSGKYYYAAALALEPDGKILIGADSQIARLNGEGSLDTSFGANGTLTATIGSTALTQITALLWEPDGKILAVGTVSNGANSDFAFLRYLSNGTVDTTKQKDMGGDDYAEAITLSADGQVVVAGDSTRSSGSSDDFALWNIEVNGPPTATISGPRNGLLGQQLSFDIGALDPSLTLESAGITYQVNWGDGTAVQSVKGTDAVSLTHVYMAAGAFSASVVADDKNSVASAATTFPVTIAQAALEPDASNPGSQTLMIAALPGANEIRISAGTSPGTVVVTYNGQDDGQFTVNGAIDISKPVGESNVTIALTVDYANGYFSVPNGITLNAGGSDTLTIAGGNFAGISDNAFGPGSGEIYLQPNSGLPSSIKYSGVASIAVTVAATAMTICIPAGSQDARLEAADTSDAEEVAAISGSFASISFADPSGTLNINGGGSTGGVKLTVPSLGPSFNADLVIALLGGGNDEVEFSGPLALSDGRSITAAAQTITDIGAPISVAGGGNIILESGSSLVLASSLAAAISPSSGAGGDLSLSTTSGDIRQAGGALAVGGTVALDSPGNIGSAASPIEFDANETPAAVVVGAGSNPKSVYLDSQGSLVLANMTGSAATTAMDVTARNALTVTSGAKLDAGAGTLSLSADTNSDGTGDNNTAPLAIQAGAVVVSSSSAANAITLRGAKIDIDTSGNPAVIGSRVLVGNGTSSAIEGFAGPAGVAIDGAGNLYVANSNGTISKVDAGSHSQSTYASGFDSPWGLAFDTKGNLYVSNAGNSTISMVAAGTHAVVPIITSGLDLPKSIVFDSSGDLYVTNSGNNTISKVAVGTNTPVSVFTTASPQAIAIDAAGNLFVANADGTISKVAAGTSAPNILTSGVAGAQGIAVDAADNVFVASSNGNISEIPAGNNSAVRLLTTVAGNQWGVAVDASGDLYVSNANTNVVAEVQPSLIPAAGGVVIRSSVPTNPISIGSGDNGAAGINLTASELARIQTMATGTVTIGDNLQTGNISFTAAIVATTPGAATQILQAAGGTGQIILDEGNGSRAALDGNEGTITLMPGSGGVQVIESSNATGGVALVTDGFNVPPVPLYLSLKFMPTSDTSFTLIDNTASASTALHGAFSNLTSGSTLAVQYNGVTRLLAANYSGGRNGNDLVLTVAPLRLAESIYVVGSDTVIMSAANGVLANNTGMGRLTVTASTVTGTDGGTFVFHTDGSFTYTPPANFPGVDSVQYTASDAQGDTAQATVIVLSQTGGVVWKFYESVLNRDPDQGGLKYWINDFVHGGKTGDIAAGFFESDELLNRIVADYYRQYLLRTPDDSGLAYWRKVWHATGGPESIKAGFADSPEFYASAGGTAEAWVTELYRRVLDREPDAQGKQYWLNYLATHSSTEGSRNQIALGFFTSVEAYKGDVTSWFDEYLQRAPTIDELSDYASQMQAGSTDRDIEQEITNLAEYGQNPPAAPPGTGVRLPDYFPQTTSSGTPQQTAIAAKDSLFAKLGA